MEKNYILAFVVIFVVIIGWTFLQPVFFPPAPVTGEVKQEEQAEQVEKEEPQIQIKAVEQEGLIENNYIQFRTKIFDITFSNRGGVITSLILKNIKNEDIEMIYAGDANLAKEYPFSVHVGDFEQSGVYDLFAYERLSANKIEFSRVFEKEESQFKLVKTYTLYPSDYIIELSITVENLVNDYLDLNFDGVMYTLGIGPQIGPAFEQLDGRSDYRKFIYFDGGRQERNVQPGKTEIIENAVNWASVSGKYFSIIAIPSERLNRIICDSRMLDDTVVPVRSALYMERIYKKTQMVTDDYKFYIGPHKPDILHLYDDPTKNDLGMSNTELYQVLTPNFLDWFASILKVILDFFYAIVRNYGVAIIMLTIVFKAVFFPLTRKSYQSMSKMQALAPRINEIKEKYKGNPQKMNMEIAAVYKQEKVSPLGGCLPMLIQLPVMFALYHLFNTDFDLRSAAFFGWISDLSVPETIWNFAPFSIPILGWQNLRLLPVIMVVTQLLSTKFTRATKTADKKMKYLPFILSAVFFFILYDLPSGLVLYWTVQGILTIGQQILINKLMKNKEAAAITNNAGRSKAKKRR